MEMHKEAHCRIHIPEMRNQGEIEKAHFNNKFGQFTTMDVGRAYQATD
jgi:hypothetical protein